MAAALSRQLRQLSAADSLTVVEAFSSWYAAGAPTPDQQQQQQQQQQRDPQLQRLLGGLLVQAAAASATFKPQQLTHILGTLGLQMGFTAAEPSHESAVLQLLSELSHEHNLAALNTRQLVQLLQAIKALGVTPGDGFVAAVQREGVKPRLTQLRAQEFADLAQALAGLRVLMEYEVLDGYWTELEGSLQKLTGGRKSRINGTVAASVQEAVRLMHTLLAKTAVFVSRAIRLADNALLVLLRRCSYSLSVTAVCKWHVWFVALCVAAACICGCRTPCLLLLLLLHAVLTLVALSVSTQNLVMLLFVIFNCRC
jgi:hypothetical protein